MCFLHDGRLPKRVLEMLDDDVDTFGYATLAVDGCDDHPPWAFTVGLAENFAHPELSVARAEAELASDFLDELAALITNGCRVAENKDFYVDGIRFHAAAVDRLQWAGDLFAGWRAYYDWRGTRPSNASAISLVPCVEQLRAQERALRRAIGRHPGSHLRSV